MITDFFNPFSANIFWRFCHLQEFFCNSAELGHKIILIFVGPDKHARTNGRFFDRTE